MYIKSFLLVSSLAINLGSVSELSSDEIKIDSETKTASKLLDDYYDEFKQSAIVNDNCNCSLDFPNKQDSLVNYYSEFLK